MPTSKEAQSRQNRQMEKVAVARLEHEKKQKRKRIMYVIVGTVAAVIVAFAGYLINNAGNDSVTTLGEAPKPQIKKCVGLKDTLPEGAPKMTIKAGDPPKKLVKTDIKEGTGDVVEATSIATVDYVGVACSTGKIFDTSYGEGKKPFEANMAGGTIDGWLQGIPGMKVGGERQLTIPPDLAYGPGGQGDTIGPDETLIFTVALRSVKAAPPTSTSAAAG